MIVVDASTFVNAFVDDGPAGELARDELVRDSHWAAPEHGTIEVFSAIRGRWLGRRISEARAVEALALLADAMIETVPVRRLMQRMWELRHDVGAYDAAYVALAEAAGCPLVTADTRLARVDDLRCEVRLTAH